MMKRLHRSAPWIMCFLLLAMGLTMGASAAGNSPEASGLVVNWAEWIVGNAIALIGGLIAWTQLTLHSVRKSIEHAIMEHDGREDVHKVASSHNHQPFHDSLHRLELLLAEVNGKLNTIVASQEEAVAELTEQETRLGVVEKGLDQLLAEHCFLHGQAMRKRSGDHPTINLEELRGVE